MLRKMPQRMATSMPEVIKAIVAKLASAESSPLITSLLIVLAQLVHVNAQQLLDFLAAQPAPGETSPTLRAQQQCRPFPRLVGRKPERSRPTADVAHVL